MKNNTISVVYHSGKEDLKELMTKLVIIKVSNNDIYSNTFHNKEKE